MTIYALLRSTGLWGFWIAAFIAILTLLSIACAGSRNRHLLWLALLTALLPAALGVLGRTHGMRWIEATLANKADITAEQLATAQNAMQFRLVLGLGGSVPFLLLSGAGLLVSRKKTNQTPQSIRPSSA